MSKVQLNKIVVNESISTPDYYVASVLNSESGLLRPTIINSTAMINSFYGDFKYKEMYLKFIESKVPVLLTPILTPISKYNRCSLRLNTIGSNINHCHPRYGTDYQQLNYGEIINQSFTNDSEVLVHTNSRVPLPYQVIVYDNGELVDLDVAVISARYELVDEYYMIRLSFTEKLTGYVLIERLPNIDNNPELSNSIVLNPGSNIINLGAVVFPDLVVLNSEGESLDYSCTYDQISGSISIDCNQSATLYYRMVPLALSVIKHSWDDAFVINHDLGYYPVIKTIYNEGSSSSLIDIIISHQSVDKVMIQLTDNNDTSIIYNIVNVNNRIDVNQVELGESIFNVMLDFSNVTETDYQRLIGDGKPPLYFILLINGTRYLFIRYDKDYSEQVPADYYDKQVTLSPSLTRSINDYIKELLNQIEGIVGESNLSTFESECINCITNAFHKASSDYPTYDESSASYIDDQVEQWYSEIKNTIYSTELFLGDYRVLINFLDQQLFNDGEFLGTDLDTIIKSIKSSELFFSKRILINYIIKSEELNYYYFPSLRISSSFNHNQDTLCSLSDKDKLIEFYALMKGSVGREITITILDDKRHPNYYHIDISSSGGVNESYYCYVGANEDKLDAINIRDINQRSALVEVVLYDYRLPSGILVDQSTYPFTEYDPNRVIEVKLPTGTYHMDRIENESWIYEDYRNTLQHLGECSYYPDFFLCPDMIREDSSLDDKNYLLTQIEDIKSYVKGNVSIGSGLVEDGKYSQACIGLTWRDFQNHEVKTYETEDSRILYTYGDATESSGAIPIMYYYVINILQGAPIRIPIDDFIYDIDTIKVGNAVLVEDSIRLIIDALNNQYLVESPDNNRKWIDESEASSMMSILDELNINYLSYNNLYYYYKGISEQVSSVNDFFVQYNASKIAREFYKIKHHLVSTTDNQRLEAINNNVTKLLVLLNHLDSLSTDFTINGRTLELNITAITKNLVNKLYDINYIINIS